MLLGILLSTWIFITVQYKLISIGVTKNSATGKSYAVYAITVTKHSPTGDDSWEVYRRYSDFHDLHMQLKEKVYALVNIWLK